MFTEIPSNKFGLSQGDVLLATEQPFTKNGETAVEFLKALGGDAETYIVLFGMTSEGYLRGMPLGKIPFFAEFDPSWSVDQLCLEIEAGSWRVIKKKDPEYHNEVLRRLKAFDAELDKR